MNLAEAKALPRAQDYPGMVRGLFTKELGGADGQRMHATIGIAGECAELVPAYLLPDEDNFIEESGDALFYFQALLNMTGYDIRELEAMGSTVNQTVQDYEMHCLSYCAGELLDQAKKCWVYGREFDASKFKQAMANWIIAFEEFLRWDSPRTGDGEYLTLDDCMAHNQNKLVTGKKPRYAGGSYSDAAAIARADKAQGE
jgi:phosphoribosyl-ATP pyrophosphohydrolase